MSSLPPAPIHQGRAHGGTPSPCVRLCTLNDDEVCVGCGRTLADITGWTLMNEAEKAACVARADVRRLALRPAP